jgi:hypothetical protein
MNSVDFFAQNRRPSFTKPLLLFSSSHRPTQEESSSWVERTILVASVTEDADAITEMHDAVLGGKRVYAVDGPDGEHDFEDLVRLYHRSF